LFIESHHFICSTGYSYIDANGVLQTVSYTADDKNGFRVKASNLPQPPKNDLQTLQDTPEVAAAKTNHLSELRKANWQDQNLLSYKILPSYFSFAQIQQEGNSEADLNVNTRETEVSYSFPDISIEVCLDKRNENKKASRVLGKFGWRIRGIIISVYIKNY
jgi:hypothetical protein